MYGAYNVSQSGSGTKYRTGRNPHEYFISMNFSRHFALSGRTEFRRKRIFSPKGGGFPKRADLACSTGEADLDHTCIYVNKTVFLIIKIV